VGIDDKRIEYAVKHTEVLRPPKRSLATFGTTNVHYYLVTEPSYTEVVNNTSASETVIREGKVIAERPKIVTPYYLSRLEGFSLDARKYFEIIMREHGSDTPGLFYTYKNEPADLTIVSDSWPQVAQRLIADIDKRGDPLASVIKGEDDLWDVSLMKFIYDITSSSLQDNITQLGARGLMNIDSSGVPADARMRIEKMFQQVARGEREPRELKKELDHWGIFDEYEDRFLSLFRKGRR
jgi:hypothetical protein